MAIDFGGVLTTDNYSTAFVPKINEAVKALAMMLDPSTASYTGAPPTNAKRINAGVLEQFNGTSWTAQSINGISYAASVASTAGKFSVGGALDVTGAVTLTAGTVNGVAYINGSKVLTSNALLTFDGANLGVGAAASAWGAGYRVAQLANYGALFDVNAGQAGQVANLYNNGTNWVARTANRSLAYVMDVPSGSHLIYSQQTTSAGAAVTLTQIAEFNLAGNLGLSTSPFGWGPGYRAFDIYTYGAFAASNGGTVNMLANLFSNGTGFQAKTTNRSLLYQQDVGSGSHTWLTGASTAAGSTVTLSTLLQLDSAGNLGVGGNAVNSGAGTVGIQAIGTSQAMFDAYLASTRAATFGATSSAVTIGAVTGVPLNFVTSNATRVSIDAAGVFTYASLEVGFRDMPRVTTGLVRGKCYDATGNFTLNTGTADGGLYAVYNTTSSAIAITEGSGMTLRLGGTATHGNRSIAPYGMAMIWGRSTSEAVMWGVGVS